MIPGFGHSFKSGAALSLARRPHPRLRRLRFASTTPAGEWNALEITARGNVLTLWVNGAVTCEVNNCGNPKGMVGAEGEGNRIEFRNVKGKELR